MARGQLFPSAFVPVPADFAIPEATPTYTPCWQRSPDRPRANYYRQPDACAVVFDVEPDETDCWTVSPPGLPAYRARDRLSGLFSEPLENGLKEQPPGLSWSPRYPGPPERIPSTPGWFDIPPPSSLHVDHLVAWHREMTLPVRREFGEPHSLATQPLAETLVALTPGMAWYRDTDRPVLPRPPRWRDAPPQPLPPEMENTPAHWQSAQPGPPLARAALPGWLTALTEESLLLGAAIPLSWRAAFPEPIRRERRFALGEHVRPDMLFTVTTERYLPTCPVPARAPRAFQPIAQPASEMAFIEIAAATMPFPVAQPNPLAARRPVWQWLTDVDWRRFAFAAFGDLPPLPSRRVRPLGIGSNDPPLDWIDIEFYRFGFSLATCAPATRRRYAPVPSGEYAPTLSWHDYPSAAFPAILPLCRRVVIVSAGGECVATLPRDRDSMFWHLPPSIPTRRIRSLPSPVIADGYGALWWDIYAEQWLRQTATPTYRLPRIPDSGRADGADLLFREPTPERWLLEQPTVPGRLRASEFPFLTYPGGLTSFEIPPDRWYALPSREPLARRRPLPPGEAEQLASLMGWTVTPDRWLSATENPPGRLPPLAVPAHGVWAIYPAWDVPPPAWTGIFDLPTRARPNFAAWLVRLLDAGLVPEFAFDHSGRLVWRARDPGIAWKGRGSQ